MNSSTENDAIPQLTSRMGFPIEMSELAPDPGCVARSKPEEDAPTCIGLKTHTDEARTNAVAPMCECIGLTPSQMSSSSHTSERMH